MDMAVLPREYVWLVGPFVRGARFGEDSPEVENGEKSLIKELIFLHTLAFMICTPLKREFLSCERRCLAPPRPSEWTFFIQLWSWVFLP